MERASGVWISLVFLCLLSLCGCVCIPEQPAVEPDAIAALSGHVDFLTRPALKGRAAGSWESAHVRRYLAECLSQYGCVPWKDNRSFELDFGFGRNIIGVLPGSDPQLANEIVLISAHYDHLKPKWFSYYPGACDNAAAVAVLLETARALSQSDHRPRRSVVFAFFDAEEMMCLGSFAFTCRSDYDDSQIAAVLNMDLLGRDLLDAVDNSLIVTGAEHYARIHAYLDDACTANELTFIPLEADLIGPVGDHVAFTSGKRPVLFFTCGINKDYHQITDTPEKLNFNKLKRQGGVVEQTLLALADGAPDIFERRPVPITRELFLYLLDKFKQSSRFFELDPNDIKTLDELIAKTKQADPNTITRGELLTLQREALGKLIAMLKNYDATLSQYGSMFLDYSILFALHPETLTDTYRQAVRHYVNHMPTFFGKNEFFFQSNLPLTEKDWGIVKTGDDEFLFGVLNSEVILQNEIHFLRRIVPSFAFKHKLTACKGSLDQVIEHVFAGSDPNGMISQTDIETYITGFEDLSNHGGLSEREITERRQLFFSDFIKTLEHRYAGDIMREKYEKYVDPNVGGANHWSIFITAHDVSEDKGSEAASLDSAIQFLQNTSQHVADRIGTACYLAYIKNSRSLTAMVEVVDDTTVYTPRPLLIDDPNFPLREHSYVIDRLARREKRNNTQKDKTLGQIVLEHLKGITKQDFGTDKDAWKKFIHKHYK